MLFFALSAILLPLLLLIVFKLSARISMLISATFIILIGYFLWQMSGAAILASIIQAIHRALTIGFILFGAITLLKTLENSHSLTRIKLGLHTISKDMRIQAVLVAFCFVSLIEGISGFGTPAIVAAPLLIILGFKPLSAAVLALIGDSVAVTFGAVGTPLNIGLENVTNYSPELILEVGGRVTMFDLLVGTILPTILVAILIFSFGGQTTHQKWLSLKEILPWTIFIGAIYSISAFLIVRFMGVELVAIIAGFISLIFATLSAKKGWLIPKNEWRHHANSDVADQVISPEIHKMPLIIAWLPYLVVIGLLIISRTIPAIRNFLNNSLDLGIYQILNIENISSAWAILYSPGTILLIGAVITGLIIHRSGNLLTKSIKEASKTTISAILTLIPTLILVQIFTNSGINQAEIMAMPLYIGDSLAKIFGEYWLAVSPILGAIGAFVAGSSTVSALTMANVQVNIASAVGLSTVDTLALQMMGAAAGNIIAIHNVVAVSIVVGLMHRESLILRRVSIPILFYLSVLTLIGIIASLI